MVVLYRSLLTELHVEDLKRSKRSRVLTGLVLTEELIEYPQRRNDQGKLKARLEELKEETSSKKQYL
ncbi:hypothetical protein AVEN_105799-1, partial [Araneus ventricosus]